MIDRKRRNCKEDSMNNKKIKNQKLKYKKMQRRFIVIKTQKKT